MDDPRKQANNRQNLKAALNEIELRPYNRQQNDLDVDELRLSQPEEDQLQRKGKLLGQRLKILENTTVQTWNRLFTVFNMVAILSISGMQFGYGIIEITTIYNQTQLLQTYNISSLPFGLGVGLLVGLMPIGAVFGNLIGKCIVSRLSLKNAHHLVNLLCMVSSFALMQITLEGTIFAGRFLYGFCIACYCAWSPRYIQDIAPVNLKVFVRSVYSIWVVGAMMLGYFFGVIFYHNSVNNYYRIMFCFPGIMAAIQLLLMWLFVPNSPAQLFEKQSYEQGRKVLQLIYKEEFVDMMVDRFKLQAEVKALKTTSIYSNGRSKYGKNRLRAKFMGIYLNIFRQFVGINTIIVYAGLVIGENDYNLGSYTNFILSIIGFVATVFSHIFLADRFNRKLLMLISTVVFSICNFMIMTGILTGITYLTFAFMIIFIFVFGVTYSIVSSIYPAEILRSKQVSYTSLTAWPAMILATLIPPIVSDVITPSHLPWPIFLFYGVYALFSTIYIWCYAVQSKQQQYSDILQQF